MRVTMQLMVAAAGLLLASCGSQPSAEQPVGHPSENTSVAAVSAPPAAFAVCASCHAVTPGRNGAGPSLAGIWGQKAATRPGYAYSKALRDSGIVWDEASLDRWLAGPMQMVPGTKMVIGIPNPEARRAVIEYLKTLK